MNTGKWTCSDAASGGCEPLWLTKLCIFLENKTKSPSALPSETSSACQPTPRLHPVNHLHAGLSRAHRPLPASLVHWNGNTSVCGYIESNAVTGRNPVINWERTRKNNSIILSKCFLKNTFLLGPASFMISSWKKLSVSVKTQVSCVLEMNSERGQEVRTGVHVLRHIWLLTLARCFQVVVTSILGWRNLWFRGHGCMETGQWKWVSILGEKLVKLISSVLSGFKIPCF